MTDRGIMLFSAIFLVCVARIANGSPVVFPAPKGRPMCSTSSALCGMDFRYVMENDLPVQLSNSENEICRCPGNTPCPIDNNWTNMTNSIVQRLFTGGNNQLLVKLSYCELPKKPRKPCGFNQPVMISRGTGPLKFDIVGDIMCSCTRPLVQRSAWYDTEHDFAEYGCGQPKCSKRNTTICSELTLTEGALKSQYLCRCRRQEVCKGDQPEVEGQSVKHTCQSMEY